jgi:glycerol dehydrogenase
MSLMNKDVLRTAIIMPMQYRQGPGIVDELPAIISRYGIHAQTFLITTAGGLSRLGEDMLRDWRSQGMQIQVALFNGECSDTEIERLKGDSERCRSTVIVGIGGGKLLDAAKSVANRRGLPVVIVPTIASSDAPCSALSVIYDEQGRVARFENHPHNPDVVLVDTNLIIRAPIRYLAAGMGDALATAPEALACLQGGGKTILGAYPTRLGTAAAELCGRILEEDGIQAFKDAKNGEITDAFERVVEANTLLSGIGFESGGLAAAHSLHDGLTELPECHHLLHGEKVGFCTAVQAVLFGQPDEAQRYLQFCRQIGLPVTLTDVGLGGESPTGLRAKLLIVAKRTLAPGETIHLINKSYAVAEIVEAFEETNKIAQELFV